MKKKSIIRKWTHALGFLQGLKKKKVTRVVQSEISPN